MQNFFGKLKAARGEIKVDLLIKNGFFINVLSGEIYKEDIAIHEGRFIGFGSYDSRETLDISGKYISPGFIDSHIHFESTMLSLPEFSKALLMRGTTAAIIDPHEISNVIGFEGIKYVLDSIEDLPLFLFVMLPSCVPATHMESAGSTLTSRDLSYLINNDHVAGMGEMMNFPGVISGDKGIHEKIFLGKDKKVDGHAPGVSGKELNAYIFAGIDSDHESTNAEEALEKLRKGMHILIREGTSERNLDNLIKIVTKDNASRFSFATDDKNPIQLMEEGHLDFTIRKAIKNGIDPITAYQMATIFPAKHYRLKNIGAIIPGFRADFVILSDLKKVKVEAVYKNGKPIVEHGKCLLDDSLKPMPLRSTVNPGTVTKDDLKVKAEGKKMRVIDLVPGQIITKSMTITPNIENGLVVSDIKKDILKIVVIERHHATGRIAKGFLHGMGFKEGAIGTTVAHDAHNIVICGTNDDEIWTVFEHIRTRSGGLVVAKNKKITSELPLPIAGLVSDQPLATVVENFKVVLKDAKQLGCPHADPFMILSFLCLSPIPSLKLTDQGLVDVDQFKIVSLFIED